MSKQNEPEIVAIDKMFAVDKTKEGVSCICSVILSTAKISTQIRLNSIKIYFCFEVHTMQ